MLSIRKVVFALKYSSVVSGEFVERPNRFIAKVNALDKSGDFHKETVHVRNTGRCREILVKGTKVFLEPSQNPLRKTKYSLVSAYKGLNLINIDSQIPNPVVFDALKSGFIKEIPQVTFAKCEVVFGNSRFDIYFESGDKKGFIEVKGATLENNGIASFPDAPTERGTKHVYGMIDAVKCGYMGNILFLIQMKGVKMFTPNASMDEKFAKALKEASTHGVNILAYDSIITENEIILDKPVPVKL